MLLITQQLKLLLCFRTFSSKCYPKLNVATTNPLFMEAATANSWLRTTEQHNVTLLPVKNVL